MLLPLIFRMVVAAGLGGQSHARISNKELVAGPPPGIRGELVKVKCRGWLGGT